MYEKKEKVKIERKEFEIDMYGIYLTLAELSKATGIDSRKLRYLDEKGKIKPVCKSINGYRYYSESQVYEAMEIVGKRVIVVYHTGVENKELVERVKDKEKDKTVIEVIEDAEGNELDKIIKQASKGLVSKIYIPDEKNMITEKWDEYSKWLLVMGTKLERLGKEDEEQ